MTERGARRDLVRALAALSLEHQAGEGDGVVGGAITPADDEGLRAAFDELVRRVAARGRGRRPHVGQEEAERHARAALLEVLRAEVRAGTLPRALVQRLADGGGGR